MIRSRTRGFGRGPSYTDDIDEAVAKIAAAGLDPATWGWAAARRHGSGQPGI